MKQLYENLMALCDAKDESKFYFTDDVSPSGKEYRIFSYNYASYSDWLLPDALECRGIMFEMMNDKPVRIAARPMEKFFNLNETPFTMNLDLSKAQYMLTKADGSLVSSFMDGMLLRFKSKSSIKSEQAHAATAILTMPQHEALLARLIDLSNEGFTANFEYVAPDNRIILPYQERELILLNIRDNDTGEYVDYDDIYADGVLRRYLVEAQPVPEGDFVSDIRKMEGIEGFVFVMEDGLRFKLKTEWYCALHHTKDSITKNDRLFEVIVANAVDDLKGMFVDDPYSLNKINVFEQIYVNYLGAAFELCHETYAALRGKDRREFAIEAQTIVNKAQMPMLFSVIMQMYTGGCDNEKLLAGVNKMFLKNLKQFIPKEYI